MSYAKDTSKKICAGMKSKGEASEHLCTNPPHGYTKDPEKKAVATETSGTTDRRT